LNSEALQCKFLAGQKLKTEFRIYCDDTDVVLASSIGIAAQFQIMTAAFPLRSV